MSAKNQPTPIPEELLSEDEKLFLEERDFVMPFSIVSCIEDIAKDMNELYKEKLKDRPIGFLQEMHKQSLEPAKNLFDELFSEFFSRKGDQLMSTLDSHKYMRTFSREFVTDFQKGNNLNIEQRVFLVLYYSCFYYNIKFALWKEEINDFLRKKFPKGGDKQLIKSMEVFTKGDGFLNNKISNLIGGDIDVKFIKSLFRFFLRRFVDVNDTERRDFFASLLNDVSGIRLKPIDSAVKKYIRQLKTRKGVKDNGFFHDGLVTVISHKNPGLLKAIVGMFRQSLNKGEELSVSDKGLLKSNDDNPQTIPNIIPFSNVTTGVDIGKDKFISFGEWSFRYEDKIQIATFFERIRTIKNIISVEERKKLGELIVKIDNPHSFWMILITMVYGFNHHYYKFTQDIQLIIDFLGNDRKKYFTNTNLQRVISNKFDDIAEVIYNMFMKFRSNEENKSYIKSKIYLGNMNGDMTLQGIGNKKNQISIIKKVMIDMFKRKILDSRQIRDSILEKKKQEFKECFADIDFEVNEVDIRDTYRKFMKELKQAIGDGNRVLVERLKREFFDSMKGYVEPGKENKIEKFITGVETMYMDGLRDELDAPLLGVLSNLEKSAELGSVLSAKKKG